MLVENQLIEVKMNSHTVAYYRGLGYDVGAKDTIYVPPHHLTDGSHAQVKVVCDICHKPYNKEYRNYLKGHTYEIDCCKECAPAKNKMVILQKYGTTCVFTLPEVKEKIKNSNLQNYGVEHVSQREDVKQKTIATNLQRRGVPYPMQNQEVMNKSIASCLEKYGVERAIQNENIKNKVKSTLIAKYGVDNPMKSEEIKQKTKSTCLDRYGVEYACQSEESRKKTVATCMKKYGVPNVLLTPDVQAKIKTTLMNKFGTEYVSQAQEVKDKVVKTCMDRYGVSNVSKVDEVKQKIVESFYRNGTCSMSKPQQELYEIIKQRYLDAELNYPVSKCSLDIFVRIQGVPIDIEYDGWPFHQDKANDLRRDKYLQKQGFKTLRVRSGTLLPTEEELFSAIDELVTTNRIFKEIILSDWKEPEDKNKTEEVI